MPRRSPRRLALVASALAAALALSACGNAFQTAAAIVDGHKITDEQLERQLDLALADPQTTAQLGTGHIRDERIRHATRQLLSILIQEQLVDTYARERGIEVDGAELDQEVTRTVQQAGGEDAFLAALHARGLTLSDVRDNVERVLLYQQVQREIVSEAVSDQELRTEYEQRRAEFADLHLAHIVLASEQDAARVKAEVTRKNFAAVAERESLDQSTAPAGGDLGFQPATELDPALARAAVTARPGTIGGPVQAAAGWEVFLLYERREIPFEQARESLLQERTNSVFNQWLTDRLRAADIRVNPRYGRLDLRTGTVVPVTSTTPLQVQLTP